MIKAAILGPHNTMATTVFGPMDILNQAGRLWNRVHRTPAEPLFEVTVVSADGKPIRSVNNIEIKPHCGIDQVKETDLLIIASATHIDEILHRTPELVPWIRDHYQRGAHVASICTGVFLLAETGLLDGLSATLHWGMVDLFRERYPRVGLNQDRIFLDHGRLYCSAGVTAGMDLSLHLVDKLCGRQAAVRSAKTMILDLGRRSQRPYESFSPARDHGDPQVARAQELMEQRQGERIDYGRLARELGLSRRSLERRFKQALDMTPLAYLQRLRVEFAKRLLEQGGLSFAEITFQAGYEDVAFFRKLFIRLTGLKPGEYRQMFGTRPSPGS